MNILILSERYPPEEGGVAVSTRRLAQGLRSAGHAVRVCVLSDQVLPGGSQVTDDKGLPVYRTGVFPRQDDTLSQWFEQIVRLCRAEPADLIHAMYITHPAFVAVWAARFLELPVVISARGNDLERTAFDPARFSQAAWSLQQASAVTAVTGELARKARALAPNQAIHVVPNGVDASLFSPAPVDETLAASLGLANSPRVAFVGEARQKKGLTILLPAFARLCERISPIQPVLLLVGGVRKDDASILQVFQKQQPNLRIQVVPPVPHAQLPAYYRLADFLVIPSLRDGLPNALLEGMACGKAVIASSVGGMAEVLCQDGVENGLLVPPGDAASLAEAMARLLTDPGLRERLGQAARQTVQQKYTLQAELDLNLRIYQELTGRRPA